MFLLFFTTLYTILSTYMMMFYVKERHVQGGNVRQIYHVNRLSAAILTKCFRVIDKLMYKEENVTEYIGNEKFAEYLMKNLYRKVMYEDEVFRCVRFVDLMNVDNCVLEMARGLENRIFVVHYKGEVKKRNDERENTTNPLDPWFVFSCGDNNCISGINGRVECVKIGHCWMCDDVDMFVKDKKGCVRSGCEVGVNRYKLFYHNPYVDNNICDERDIRGVKYQIDDWYDFMKNG